jgi:hypothetical protein
MSHGGSTTGSNRESSGSVAWPGMDDHRGGRGGNILAGMPGERIAGGPYSQRELHLS